MAYDAITEIKIAAKKPWLDDKRAKKLIIGTLLALLLYIIGFGVFLARLDFKPAGTIKTDAIIVLTGDGDRIEEAVAALNDGRAKQLFISGVERRGNINRILDRILSDLRARADLRARIETGHATNTLGNGLESREWAEKNGIRSVRVVTSFYHMPRAMLVFRKYLPNVRLVPSPVSHGFESSWQVLRRPAATRLAFKEYGKFVATWALDTAGVSDSFINRIR
ncbi:MAG: YdcF family protein [Rickettsiales bacterium]|nr:YdcF family protein [Rickettsiales bacterium]